VSCSRPFMARLLTSAKSRHQIDFLNSLLDYFSSVRKCCGLVYSFHNFGSNNRRK